MICEAVEAKVARLPQRWVYSQQSRVTGRLTVLLRREENAPSIRPFRGDQNNLDGSLSLCAIGVGVFPGGNDSVFGGGITYD